MFSKPKAGWSTLTIEHFTFDVSYTTDVPNDIIRALLIALKHNISTVVTVDGESVGEASIIFDMVSGKISIVYCNEKVTEDFRIEQDFYNTSVKKFAKEFIKDIEDNFEEWSRWFDNNSKINMEEFEELKKLIG